MLLAYAKLVLPSYASRLALLAEEDPKHHFQWPSAHVLRVIKLFADQSSAPFSLHQIVTAGVAMGKKVGEWYGPTVTAAVLRYYSR